MILKKYILISFASSFFPIFGVLFSIISLINLVKIASMTSVVNISFDELSLLYFYSLPQILYMIIPVSFFIGAISGIAKLTTQYELLVLSAIGIKPTKVLRIFIPLAFVISFSLFLLSQIIIPKTSYLSELFLKEKSQEAALNIKASQFGQKFGKWMVFISDKDTDRLTDIKLFEDNDEKSRFIISSTANIENKSGDISLKLKDGFGYFDKESTKHSIDILSFKELIILNKQKQIVYKNFENFEKYWQEIKKSKKKAIDFSETVHEILFPIVMVFFIISLGYFNPRFATNKASMLGFAIFLAYFVLYTNISKIYPFASMIVLPLFWLILSYIIYVKTIKFRY
ncbi:MAG: hypothetical protein B1H07_04825 [Campylobacteraceae bacterium 4484_166]|nr:MAG: hypothetical protein B1H07_04825 [Campylobacteraceae bacterium 4484_166]